MEFNGERTCPVCGKVFAINKRQRTKKFCSGECQREGARRKDKASNRSHKGQKPEKGPIIKQCVICGKDFVYGDGGRRKFCSTTCRCQREAEQQRKYYKAEKQARPAREIQCKACGKVFYSSRKNVKYCESCESMSWDQKVATQKWAENGICKFNHEVSCQNQSNCLACGFNPEVSKARANKRRYEMEAKA